MAAEIETDGDYAADLVPFLRTECDSIGISEAEAMKLVFVWRILDEPPLERVAGAAEGVVTAAHLRRGP